jgi:hypothetical protein
MTKEIDPLDAAARLSEETVARAIDNIRNRKPELTAIGRCHYCDEDLALPALFCDAGCRDEWQREQDAKKRRGG